MIFKVSLHHRISRSGLKSRGRLQCELEQADIPRGIEEHVLITQHPVDRVVDRILPGQGIVPDRIKLFLVAQRPLAIDLIVWTATLRSWQTCINWLNSAA